LEEVEVVESTIIRRATIERGEVATSRRSSAEHPGQGMRVWRVWIRKV
jgi:hypothetical protein